jgi:acetyl-CoA carboxylase biotin carboxylase subunit
MFRKVLVANRGEIAVRVIRALRELGVSSVAVFSEADRKALHVLMADEAVCIGPAASSESYLCAERIFEAARQTTAQAIHPGYGFLSENAAFARECEDRGIKFIGPSSQSIESMGSKTAARKLAAAVGAPVVPGTDAAITSTQQAKRVAAEIGYPVLIKAAAGGGGKGMRRVETEKELSSAMRSAAGEAERAFGSNEVYLEKLIDRPRHIEVQILGDEFGHLIHLGERECSIQRRHQKVIEESPSPLFLKRRDLRNEIGEAALRIARKVGYFNAGTLEFLADQDGKFYFLEMNTRLQVEHPVTEMVTGLDLVHWQLRIAAGEKLTLKQEDVSWRGSAIECRIYAEDPANNFFPSPGRIAQYTEPSGPGVRIDGGVYSGWNVPLDYDPLLAKLVTWAETRESAIKRMQRAISEYHILGITTNIALFSHIMADPMFREGKLHTGYLDDEMKNLRSVSDSGEELQVALLASAVQAQQELSAESNRSNHDGMSAWRLSGRRNLQR